MAGSTRVRGALRLIAGNAAVLLLILWATNLCSSAILDVQYAVEPWVLQDDARATLPNYPDPDKARAMFRETNLLHTRYEAFLAWSRMPFDGEYVSIDPVGDRIHAGGSKHPVATVRFFGGSTMWGTGVADDETIPARFQALHPELRVLNHGETGFVSRQSLGRLINLVNEDAAMDLVVFYDGYNDVRSLCRFDTSVQGHKRERRIRERLRPRRNVLHSLTGATVEVLDFLRPEWKPKEAPSRCHAEPERPARVIRTLLGNWRAAREVARRGGAEFIAVLQPVAAFTTSRTDHLVNDATFKGRAHELVYPALREALAAEAQPWMVDLSRMFDREGELIFVDAAHVSPNGTEIAATRIHAIVEESFRHRLKP